MMLVEINLLPKKEHKKSSVLIMVLAGILLLSISASIILFQGSSYEDRMASLDKQIVSIQKLNEVQQAKLADGNTGSSAVKLQKAVEWAEQYPIETVPLLQKIIAVLPERGFIQELEYGHTNSVVIKIQFDASRDAAFYLSSLKESDWVEKVTLMNIAAESDDVETSNAGETAFTTQDRDAETLPRYSAEYEIFFKPEPFKKNKEMASKEGSGT
jgi:type IV pilus assembly protein PilN